MFHLSDKTRLRLLLFRLNSTLHFLHFSHGFPLKVLSAYFLLIAASRGVSAIPSGPPAGIDCRDGYAIRLSEDDRHPGRYVLCEEYDTYQELVETDQILAAHRLTHEIERTYGDGN